MGHTFVFMCCDRGVVPAVCCFFRPLQAKTNESARILSARDSHGDDDADINDDNHSDSNEEEQPPRPQARSMHVKATVFFLVVAWKAHVTI